MGARGALMYDATDHMSLYEKNALAEIYAWKVPATSWIDKSYKALRLPLEKAGQSIMRIPGVEYVIEKSAVGILNTLNDFSCWSVRKNAIYAAYNQVGIVLHNTPSDLFTYDLEQLDRALGYLCAKYKALAAAEGAMTGVAGLAGIPIDIVALVVLAQRAIGEYATYYGFDLQLQSERLYAFNVLSYAASPADLSKQAAMMELVRIAKNVAAKRAWKQIEDYAFGKMLRRIGESLGVKLTKAKMAEILPGVGAFVGGSFNTYFINKVCMTAYFLYRERFLAQKYGQQLIREIDT